MAVQIQLRRGTAAAWTAANTILAEGEIGIESDTDYIKIGDGTTAWNSLGYAPVFGAVTTATIVDANVTSAKLATSLAFTGNPTAATQTLGNDTTRLATTAFVRAEVVALVDSAPGALDTLNELAAALADDASFSTTVTNSLAAKAPLADPTFTGTVTLPTSTVTSGMILDGTIVNADINSSAGIADTKLATISTSSKVSNSATTATAANTNSAIVARDASGDFSAGTITAALTGNASGTSGSTTGNAATVTVADAGGDTTTFPMLATSATGSLAPATDAGLTYNATDNALTTTTFIGALTGTASGNLVSGGALGTPSGGAADNMTSNTESAGNSSTQIATTAFVTLADAALVQSDQNVLAVAVFG